MVKQIQAKISGHRKRIVPALVALSMLSGVLVTLLSTPSAQADYYVGCGYGYNSSGGGFGYGYGTNGALLPGFGYGRGLNGVFGYGFGDQVCPPPPTTTSTVGGGGGTTTTSTSSTTTTTGPNTTTTTTATTTTTTAAPGRKRLFANKVHGFASVGRTKRLAITGGGFYGQPRITSNERGTRIGVQHDYGNLLIAVVTVPARSRHGRYTFTIRVADGRTCKVSYLVK
jgi:hypothetical protein